MSEIKKPTRRDFTISRMANLDGMLELEGLTIQAQDWIELNAREFGKLSRSVNRPGTCFWLYLHSGYDAVEVECYLRSLWDAQEWPSVIEMAECSEGGAERCGLCGEWHLPKCRGANDGET